MNKKILAPSILTADFSNLAIQIRSLELGNADWIHCDVMDGQFVPNITFGPIVIQAIRRITKLPMDVHLMIKTPDNLLDDFINAGADIITVHQEEVIHLDRMLNRIKDLGVKCGVVLNPSTPVSCLSEVLHLVDMVLIMSVNPGFGAQKFIPNSIEKIRQLAQIRDEKGLEFLIEIDGGINKENIKSVSDAGCNVFVVGNSIFKNDNITASTVEFKNIIGG